MNARLAVLDGDARLDLTVPVQLPFEQASFTH